MSARIAPDPVSAAVSTSADQNRPQVKTHEQRLEVGGKGNAGAGQPDDARQPRFADQLPPIPPPPDPPGTAFAAAVAAGLLSPKPETPEEMALRLGSAWQPPASELKLADRKV